MNNSYLNNTGVLPNYLNTSSSDSKYLFGNNTSVEFNQFFILNNNCLIYFENDIFPLQEKKN
jgi:hypothetical protein